MILKIMTFNIRHCSDYNSYLNDGSDRIDFNVPAGIINEFGADIVGLNEVYGEGVRADLLPRRRLWENLQIKKRSLRLRLI